MVILITICGVSLEPRARISTPLCLSLLWIVVYAQKSATPISLIE